MKRIIYPTDDGGVAIVIPAAECGLTIEEIAAKDVPQGKPYKIVDVTDILEDRTFRNAWEVEITEPDGYGIGAEAWFAMQTPEETEEQE